MYCFIEETRNVRDNAGGNLMSPSPSSEAAASGSNQVSQDDSLLHLGRQTSYLAHTLDEVEEMEKIMKFATTPRKAKRVFNMSVSIQDRTYVCRSKGSSVRNISSLPPPPHRCQITLENGKSLFFLYCDLSSLSVKLMNKFATTFDRWGTDTAFSVSWRRNGELKQAINLAKMTRGSFFGGP